MQKAKQLVIGASLAALATVAPQAALAAVTPACTQINNVAGVSFSVGGVAQTGFNSNNSQFVVGNKINFTVTSQDGTFVSVIPGQTNKQLNFRITNSGNANQTFVLTLPAAAQANGQIAKGLTDNFNATNPGINSVGTATITTGVLLPGGTQDVTVNADVDAARVDGDAAVYALLAQAYKADGTTAEAQGNSSVTSSVGTCTADVVFADTTAGSDDATRDGKDSARGAFKVTSSQLSFSKNATTVWDPINGNSSPKAIPGALIQYTVTISNAVGASSAATLSQITDTLTSNLAIDPDLRTAAACVTPPCALSSLSAGGGGLTKGFEITTAGASNTRASKTTPLFFSTAADADGVGISGQAITADMTKALPAEGTYTAGLLKQGESVTLTFNTTIN